MFSPKKSSKKVAQNFYCENCDYTTSRKYNYDKHLLTLTHKNTITTNKSSKKVAESSNNFVCVCGKGYKHKSSLWNHQKMCGEHIEPANLILSGNENGSENVVSNKNISNDLFVELLKQNNEFRDMLKEQNRQMMDVLKNGVGNTINANNNNNNNRVKNKFNLNFFLNEQCKDALNIMDFVNTMQLQLSDLERVGEMGYVKGISHIVINKLKELDIYKRPIHCSDLKRETLYVKDKDAWEMETSKNQKLTYAIKHVAHKNLKQLSEWQQENPEYSNGESVKSEEYLKIVGESMGGSTDLEDMSYCQKIIKNIAKEVVIE